MHQASMKDVTLFCLHDLFDLELFADWKHLKLKEKKTNVMKFNFSHNLDFPPEMYVSSFKNEIEVVSETKLLGVILTNDLKWAKNTDFICSKAYKKLWILRRLRFLEVDEAILCDVYVKEVRSVLEVAAPAWHSGLTQEQAAQIERVQKVAVCIILGRPYQSYTGALKHLGLDTLRQRREKRCLIFAKRTIKTRHSSMFTPNNPQYTTRHKSTFKEVKTNTSRFWNSPFNYLTRLLNSS